MGGYRALVLYPTINTDVIRQGNSMKGPSYEPSIACSVHTNRGKSWRQAGWHGMTDVNPTS